MLKISLKDNWQFKERNSELELSDDFRTNNGWLPAIVPGSVHQDLLNAGKIPDPFYGLNENAVQWVGLADWLYQKNFVVPLDYREKGAAWLCFDGLDTFATVWLNQNQILLSDNMFVPQRIEVSNLLRPGQNVLQVLFETAVNKGKEREKQNGRLSCWNGEPHRLYVRKAQYHYGWDWGPCLITAGIWKEASLVISPAKISEFACAVELDTGLSKAVVSVKASIEKASNVETSELSLHLKLLNPKGQLLTQTEKGLEGGEALQQQVEILSPELWWPNNYGAQPLYTIEVSLLHHGLVLDKTEKRIGVRRLRLVQDPLAKEAGTTFLFEVNNTPIFCGGANWIPADSLTPRIDNDRYRNWIKMAADANMNMLRVWGGGIYEADIFYELCDEFGLLVWQDFMFACGIYPATEWFQQSVKAEAEATVRRLKDHPCIAIWCGNNEDYSAASSLGIYDENFQGDFTTTKFPARRIYEHLLPELCARLDPGTPYWPGSPWGGSDASSQITGDRHTWDVWHGKMEDYHKYPQFEGRFVSEFGMAALPELSTIEAFTPANQLYPNSRTLEHHNKAGDGSRRIAVYLSDNLPQVRNLEDYIYASQFVQAEALGVALREWRKRWAGPRNYAVGGALVWQLNDCWPVTSWAVVDYHLKAKPAYYVVRRELAPLSVGLTKKLENGRAVIWCVNSRASTVDVEVLVSAWTLSGEAVREKSYKLTLEANQSTEVSHLPYNSEDELILSAKMLVDGEVKARGTLWPEPFKYLSLPEPEIKISRLEGDRFHIEAKRPAKGVLLAAATPVEWSDNMFDLVPLDPIIVEARGIGDAAIRIKTLQSLRPNSIQ